MRRRDFIKAIVGATAWPCALHAQQATMPIIGFLHSGSAVQNVERLVAFRKGLSDGAFIEGRNVAIAGPTAISTGCPRLQMTWLAVASP
jgi:putative ABC transport system substrate-binding protein